MGGWKVELLRPKYFGRISEFFVSRFKEERSYLWRKTVVVEEHHDNDIRRSWKTTDRQ
jgi:hypothetical protein